MGWERLRRRSTRTVLRIVAALNASLQKELSDKGMVFNAARSASFRDKLRSAGFYAEWKAKFGDEAWALLEKYSGKLA